MDAYVRQHIIIKVAVGCGLLAFGIGHVLEDQARVLLFQLQQILPQFAFSLIPIIVEEFGALPSFVWR